MREGGESGVLLYEQKKVPHYYNGYGLRSSSTSSRPRGSPYTTASIMVYKYT